MGVTVPVERKQHKAGVCKALIKPNTELPHPIPRTTLAKPENCHKQQAPIDLPDTSVLATKAVTL